MSAFVSLENVSHAYAGAGSALAVEGLSLDVAEGEFAAVVGPSGCGKSTLMKLATGLQFPQTGTVTVAGERVSHPVKIAGMAFQAPTLLPWRTTLDNLLGRLPLVRLLYSLAKDMLNAFVGEKRRFDKPVLVAVSNDREVKVLAFLTSDSLASLGLADQVTVYMPQSYGFAGHILVVPGDRVERLDVDAAEVMAFIISGGVTQVETRR